MFVSLMYHNVYADGASFDQLSPSVTSYFTSASAFASQLRLFRSMGGRCLRTDELAAFYDSCSPVLTPASSVLFTFDDGWRGTLEVAAPILQDHKCQSLLFVTTDFIDRPLFLTRRELRDLPADVLRLGSHARSHRMLNGLSDDEIGAELRDSKHILEDLAGREIEHLSIPGGACDERVTRIAVEAGYRFLFTSAIHLNSPQRGPLQIGRVAIRSSTTLDAYRRYVGQNLSREQLRGWALQLPKRALGAGAYGRLRRRLLHEVPGQRDMI